MARRRDQSAGAVEGERGLSAVELLLATMLMLVVTAAAFAVLDPVEGRFAAELEAVDMQQRLRVAAQTLSEDLMLAGTGTDASSQGGPLLAWFAPVLPFRRGALEDDPPGSFRRDIVTVLFVPPTAARSVLTATLGPGQADLTVEQHTGCPLNSSICGFQAGMTVLVYDGSGAFDTFTVASVTGAVGQLRVNRPGGLMGAAYQPGSPVTEVVQRTYYLKTASTGDTRQLMRYDGSTNAGVPVIDHVVDLEFEYLGEPRPPRLLRPVTEPEGPWTTYGPRPPLPPGENCVFRFDAVANAHVSRLGDLTAGVPLVPLNAAELSDGDVWCPRASDPRRYDADLLRVRAVRMRVRVQSAVSAFRGQGPRFRYAGTSTHAHRLLPDRETWIHVSLRNLAMTR